MPNLATLMLLLYVHMYGKWPEFATKDVDHDAKKFLLNHDLIHPDALTKDFRIADAMKEDMFSTTPRGIVFVGMVKDTPLPTLTYTDPR